MDLKKIYKQEFREFAESARVIPKTGGEPIPFKPKKIQDHHIKNWHYRSIIVKPRQCGFTTLKNLELLFFAYKIQNGSLALVFHNDDIGKEKLETLKQQVGFINSKYELIYLSE